MFACILCHFAHRLDDVALRWGASQCICLGCFARETDSVRLMPGALRRQLSAVLAELGVAA